MFGIEFLELFDVADMNNQVQNQDVIDDNHVPSRNNDFTEVDGYC